MDNETLDIDGYPTEKCLKKISAWPWADPRGWFDFIESIWNYCDYGWKIEYIENELPIKSLTQYWISTCGWSGNEDIIRAMEKNEMLWHFHWVQSRRGGHYIFEIKEENAN